METAGGRQRADDPVIEAERKVEREWRMLMKK